MHPSRKVSPTGDIVADSRYCLVAGRERGLARIPCRRFEHEQADAAHPILVKVLLFVRLPVSRHCQATK
jgi:hypothetical protein